MKCPLSAKIDYMEDRKLHTNYQGCLKEECAWWDDSDEYCCIVDIASSLSMIVSFLKDITENGIPKRGG